MYKQIMVYLYKGKLHNKENESATDTVNSMKILHKHNSKQKKEE
jgi:hypothetical protein